MLRERSAGPASAPRSRAAISFGSPGAESGATRLALNEILILCPPAAFLMRIMGTAMQEADVDDGGLALVDRDRDGQGVGSINHARSAARQRLPSARPQWAMFAA